MRIQNKEREELAFKDRENMASLLEDEDNTCVKYKEQEVVNKKRSNVDL